MQEQALLNELKQLGLLEIENSVKWKIHRLDITQDFYVKCDPSLIVKIIRYAGSVDPHRKGRALHYNQHNEMNNAEPAYGIALYALNPSPLNPKQMQALDEPFENFGYIFSAPPLSAQSLYGSFLD